uniref:Transcriptional regulator n=1 Tax=Heterorhabditis bacteriophora TaxID=37862 RepID=A0A1I7WIE1_HETBA
MRFNILDFLYKIHLTLLTGYKYSIHLRILNNVVSK